MRYRFRDVKSPRLQVGGGVSFLQCGPFYPLRHGEPVDHTAQLTVVVGTPSVRICFSSSFKVVEFSADKWTRWWSGTRGLLLAAKEEYERS